MQDFEVKVIEEKENPFFERKELMLHIIHTNRATPSKQELTKKLVSMFNIGEEYIQIDYILSYRGKQEARAKVKIYKKPIKKIEKKEGGKNGETQGSQSQ